MIRRATLADIDLIMSIIHSAQLSLRELGIDQWQDGYPTKDSIELDIQTGVGYVACKDGRIVGYAAIVLSEEPAYRQIAELWQTDEQYVVVHRLCVDSSARRSGVAIELMQYAASLARSNGYNAFRIDTHEGNVRMMNMMQRLGFKHVGKVVYDSGEREAFELFLDLSNTL